MSDRIAMTALRLHPTVLLMASAHMMVDAYGNIYAPLLPLLIPKLSLSLTAAGTLTMLFQIAASVSQVGFGHLADRWRPRVLVMVGPVLSVLVLSMIGIAPTVGWLAVILIVGGLGAAAFHPPAAALAHRLGGSRPGLAMSVHITGGSLGFSLGPLMFAPAAQYFGLASTPALAIPGLLVVAFFLSRVPAIVPHPHERGGFRALRPYARPLGLLYVIVVLRTLASLSFATFVPVMLTRRGLSVSEAGAIVAVYLFASGAGGFLQSTLPVNVVFGQALAPVSAATVSSLMMGFAWGMGGFSVPLVGAIADRAGIERTLFGIAFVPLAAAAVAMLLPRRAPSA